MLKELLTIDRINRIKSVASWEEAIKIASAPLVKDKSIEKEYIYEMINSINKYGSYIVITDDLALPHARPGVYVNKVSLSLLYIEEGIKIDKELIHTIIVLATKDKNSHIDILQELSLLLLDNETGTILKSGNIKNIYDLIIKN